MNLNKAFIIGNLTRDPELKSLPSGIKVTSFSVATNRVWKNKEGVRQEGTEFHNIVTFGRQAEIASQFLRKGGSVMIEGRIQTRNWEAKDGSGKRYRTEIVAERLQLGPRQGGGGGGSFSSDKSSKPAKPAEELETIEYPSEESNPADIPF